MPTDDFLEMTPSPEIGLPDLGLSPMPSPPEPPQVGLTPEEAKRRRLTLVAAIIGTALSGRQIGGGFGRGLLQGLRQQDESRRAQERFAQDQFDRQQALYAQQERDHAVNTRERQRLLLAERDAFRDMMPSLASKADYERRLAEHNRMLELLGFRAGPNWLRQAVPYVAPTAEKRAAAFIEGWLANPQNKALLEDNPQAATTAVVQFDRDGDDIPERVPLPEMFALGGQPFSYGPDGQLLLAKPGSTVEEKATVDARYQDLLVIARAEGKDVDGQSREAARLRNQLRTQAQQEVENIQPPAQTSRTDRQQQARHALEAALLQGVSPSRTVLQQIRQAGLDPAVELADIRRQFMTVGRQIDAYEEDPDRLYELGRQALSDPRAFEAPTPSPAPPREPAEAITRAELQAVAKQLGITEAEAEQQAQARGMRVVP